MPIQPSYPGVYIEEIPSGVRTITGVATSIAAFIDYFPQGLMNKAIQIFSISDFEREFGGLDIRSEASYAIQQFFLNGGTEAWVIRTASGEFVAADVEIKSAINAAETVLTIEAGRLDPDTHPELSNPGTWGNNLRVTIDHLTSSANRFNMTVALVATRNGQQVVLRSETFRGLSMDSGDPSSFVKTVVNDEFSGSKLVRVTASGADLPMQNGTISGEFDQFPNITNSAPQMTVRIGDEEEGEEGTARLSAKPTSLTQARNLLESAIRAARPDLKAFAQATVSIVNNRLRILAGPTAANAQITFTAPGDDPTVTALGLSPGTLLDGILSGTVSNFPIEEDEIQVTIGSSGPILLTLPAPINNLAAARAGLESRIREESNNPAVSDEDKAAFANARVVAYTDAGEERLIVLVEGATVEFTAGGDNTINDLGLGNTATTISALISDALSPVPSVSANSAVEITLGAIGPHRATITTNASTLSAIATQLQTAIRDAESSDSFTGARVAAYEAGENRLVVLSGVAEESIAFAVAPLDNTTLGELLLEATEPESVAVANVQSYALEAGADGDPPNGLALIGDSGAKTGMHALENVDLFNILCIPRTAVVTGNNPLDPIEARTVIVHAINFCEEQRAFFIVDTPTGIDEVQEVKDWLDGSGIPRSRNAALYFPRVQIPDPLNNFKLKSVGASGTIAGLYARIDSDRGVWKAPAGTEATLRNVFKLDVSLTDSENGTLNPLAINCLRTFPVYGTICWGARTLEGANEIGSEYKYVPVRRLALFIEETLYRGLKWVVFEPNDEPLWSQIRLNVGAFMNNLFRQGAFQGRTPREAYLVKCDKETTTQNDIDQGIVNILVGFAPLKPAEFVFLKLQQLTGQIQT